MDTQEVEFLLQMKRTENSSRDVSCICYLASNGQAIVNVEI